MNLWCPRSQSTGHDSISESQTPCTAVRNRTASGKKKNHFVKELAWLCSNKTLFTKTGGKLDLACGAWFADAWFKKVTEGKWQPAAESLQGHRHVLPFYHPQAHPAWPPPYLVLQHGGPHTISWQQDRRRMGGRSQVYNCPWLESM